MKRAISSHVFLLQRLHPGLLDALIAGGAQSVELFAARHHFDYTDRSVVKELATWFRSHDVRATMHQPIFDTGGSTAGNWSRHVQATLNLIDPEKVRRIDAMDEVKRALEVAEQIAVESIVLHLGNREDKWSPRALEYSLTAIEHIKAYAWPMGVKTLLENLPNEVSTPENLLEIVKVGHFDTVGVCLDVGHAHMADGGIEAAFATLGQRVKEVHLHDNHGVKDEHLWPGEGSIDWAQVKAGINAIKEAPCCVLEIAYEPEMESAAVSKKATAVFGMLEGT